MFLLLTSSLLPQNLMVYIDLLPGNHIKVSLKDTVKVNLGDPVRKNTLCVEISPTSSEASVYH